MDDKKTEKIGCETFDGGQHCWIPRIYKAIKRGDLIHYKVVSAWCPTCDLTKNFSVKHEA